MRLIALPTPPAGVLAWRCTTALEGVDYQIGYRFNERAGCWFLSVATAEGSPIVKVRISTGRDLLEQFVMDAKPPGTLLAVDQADAGKTAGRDDLGSRILLVYLEAE